MIYRNKYECWWSCYRFIWNGKPCWYSSICWWNEIRTRQLVWRTIRWTDRKKWWNRWRCSVRALSSIQINNKSVRKWNCFFGKIIIFLLFRYFTCPPNYGIFVPLAKVSLSPLSRKTRLSRAGSRESLTSIGTLGSITSTNTSRLRMSAQVPLTAIY